MKRIPIFSKGLLAVLCIGIYGCNTDIEYCDKSRSYPYAEWTDSELKSIVNDSLAVVATYKHKKNCIDGVVETVKSNIGLFLVNYITKQKPLLGDTLMPANYDGLKIPAGAFIDSSLLLLDTKNNRLGFWKIGEKSIRFIKHDEVDRISSMNGISRWENKDVLLWGSSLILDTENGQVKQFNPAEEYEWSRNEDYLYAHWFYIGNKIVSIKRIRINDILHSELAVDGIATDTTDFIEKRELYGNYMQQNGGEYIGDGNRIKIIKINTENFKFDKNFKLWVDMAWSEEHSSNFSRLCKDKSIYSDCIIYSGQDLAGGENLR